jgi:hypothetical protein
MASASLGVTGVLDRNGMLPEPFPDFGLNADGSSADTSDMASKTDVGVAEDGTWIAATERNITARSRRQLATRVDAEAEMERLQEKVSLLVMQKDYWQQRSVEHASRLRAAEAEVARLQEALAATASPVLVGK